MSRLDARFLKKFWTVETPSGTINGSNTAFTLSQTPLENEAVQLYVDGLLETAYSLTGVNITMTTAPSVGQTLKAVYIRNTGE